MLKNYFSFVFIRKFAEILPVFCGIRTVLPDAIILCHNLEQTKALIRGIKGIFRYIGVHEHLGSLLEVQEHLECLLKVLEHLGSLLRVHEHLGSNLGVHEHLGSLLGLHEHLKCLFGVHEHLGS